MYDKETRQPFGQDFRMRDNGTLEVVTINDLPSLTQQQFKEECDVNHIMKKYTQTGELHHLSRKQGVYADMSEITDYQGMLHTVMEARQHFDALPADVREKFKNNPAELIKFVQDPNNYDEGVKLGLFEKNQNMQANNANDLNDIKKPAKKSKSDKSEKQLDEE